jgi:hypothetical protein
MLGEIAHGLFTPRSGGDSVAQNELNNQRDRCASDDDFDFRDRVGKVFLL